MRVAVLSLVLLIAAAAFAADGDTEFRLGKATLRSGNAKRAFEYFQQAADKGHAEGMYSVGRMYQEGTVVAADPAVAMQWFQRAAQGGHPASMNRYADSLRESNPAEALQWHRKAAEAGDPDGMLAYGYALSHGQGVPLDVPKAFAMYLGSARVGNSAAMFNLGEYYRTGKGVEKSPSAARFWFLRAAMDGDADAEAKFAELADVAPESPEGAALFAESRRLRMAARTNTEHEAAKVKGFPLLHQAAELGHLDAIAALVSAYQYGDGTEKDMKQARDWALIAAEMGHNSDQTIVARFMLEGIGGPRNTQGARFWFEKAALGGNSLAMSFLARIYDGNYGLPPNDALATYWWVEAYKQGSPTATKVLQERGLVAKRDPVAQAYVDRIDRNGPDRSSVERFTLEVAQYCKYGGDHCHELSVAALKFQRSSNAAVESANMARLWNAYGAKSEGDDAKWRERSDCMRKKTESIQKHTYGEQDWYYGGTCY